MSMFCRACKKFGKCNPIECDEYNSFTNEFMSYIREVGAEDIILSNLAYASPDQLCWFCKKAYGGCEWSAFGAPVKGWEAVQTYPDNQNRALKGWHIFRCPKYEYEGGVNVATKRNNPKHKAVRRFHWRNGDIRR